jgi:XTP/dITP diphosphohydrolase
MKLVIATRNQGKIREIKKILEKNRLNITLLCLEDFPAIGDIPEPGETFEENALYKAKYVSEHTGIFALSDDSGLEVDALQGKPGVYSARFAGPSATDEENNQRLLYMMKDIPLEERGAQFRCAMVLYSPTGDYILTQGIWRGKIALTPKGEGGFGYDPIFIDENLGRTAASLDTETKNNLSHRGIALRKMVKLMAPFFECLK